MDSIYMDEHVSVPIKLYFQKQRMDWLYPRAIMWQDVPVIAERAEFWGIDCASIYIQALLFASCVASGTEHFGGLTSQVHVK